MPNSNSLEEGWWNPHCKSYIWSKGWKEKGLENVIERDYFCKCYVGTDIYRSSWTFLKLRFLVYFSELYLLSFICFTSIVLMLITQNSWLLMLWLPLGIKLWSIPLNSFLLNTLMYHYSEFMPTCSDSYELQVIETFLNVLLFHWSIYKPQFYKKSYLLSLSFSLTP